MNISNSETHNKKIIFLRAMLIVGVALILISICALIWWQVAMNKKAERLQEYISIIDSIMPEKQNAVLEEKFDNSMPVASVLESDFIGVLEFRENNKKFPICADWDDIEAYPCRFKGSIYDGTIIIGASDVKGQIDFVENIFVYDKITFTDMLGDCYSYEIVDIRYSNNAEYDNLTKGNHDMTIFINKAYSSDFIIINCVSAGTI